MNRIMATRLSSQTTLPMEIKNPSQQECSQAQYSRHKRRSFLRSCSIATLAAPALLSGIGKATAATKGGMVPLVGRAEPSLMQGAVAALERNMSRSLHLINEHTGDDVNVVYYTHGIYINDGLARLNNLMTGVPMWLRKWIPRCMTSCFCYNKSWAPGSRCTFYQAIVPRPLMPSFASVPKVSPNSAFTWLAVPQIFIYQAIRPRI